MSKTRIIGQDQNLTAADIDFVPDGSIAATDVQTAIEEVRDEAGGGGAGAEVAYVEFTSNVSPTATSAATADAVVSAGSVTYAAVPHIITFFAPQFQAPTGGAGRQTILELYIDTAASGIIGVVRADGTATAHGAAGTFMRRLTPSAGAHTYEIRAWVSAGTGLVGAGAGGAGVGLPGFIRVTTV